MNRVSSIFSQMLTLVPPANFQNAVDAHRGERHSRGFRSRGQFMAMLYCKLGQAKSLREIEDGLLAAEGMLCHLNMGKAGVHSALAGTALRIFGRDVGGVASFCGVAQNH